MRFLQPWWQISKFSATVTELALYNYIHFYYRLLIKEVDNNKSSGCSDYVCGVPRWLGSLPASFEIQRETHCGDLMTAKNFFANRHSAQILSFTLGKGKRFTESTNNFCFCSACSLFLRRFSATLFGNWGKFPSARCLNGRRRGRVCAERFPRLISILVEGCYSISGQSIETDRWEGVGSGALWQLGLAWSGVPG